MSTVDDVKARIDIVELIGQYVQLKKAGHNYKGLCPFHTEKTPSFIVFPDTQTWHCFGACGTGGDMFNFVMQQEGIEFPEALKMLAERAGVSLRPQTPQEATAIKLEHTLEEINQVAAAQFHHWLLHSDVGQQARDYLQRRGIVRQTIDAFQLGYAPNDWHTLDNYMRGKGYRVNDVLSAGLLTERDEGGHYDRFRGRLMIPIRDMRGRIVGFGGRVLDDSQPKYLNSPQTALFDKSSILYGIDLAKQAIRQSEMVVIVEGYMDVLMAHQFNIKNVVASMGTALTEKQLNILKRLTKKIALALDSDTAGDKGTLRGLETAKNTLDQRWVPVPNWKGLVNYEAELDTEIKIISLPEDLDPDEIIRENPNDWFSLVNASLPVIDYYFQAFTQDLDLSAAKDKAQAVENLLPVIAEVNNPVERGHYIQQLARLVQMDERLLNKQLDERHKKQFRPRGHRPTIAPTRKTGRFSGFPGMKFGVETYCIFLLLDDPELLHIMNDVLERIELPGIKDQDFRDAQHRQMFTQVLQRWQAGNPLTVADLDDADPLWGDLVQDFLEYLDYISAIADWNPVLAAGRCALQLRRQYLSNKMLELRYLGEDKTQDARQWMNLVIKNTQEKQRLDQAMNDITVLGYKGF